MKCSHVITQKARESFNGMIQKRIQKFHDVGLQKLDFGVYDALAIFNYVDRLFRYFDGIEWKTWSLDDQTIWLVNSEEGVTFPL